MVSIGTLCDHNCIAHFSKNEVIITHNDRILLRGKRDSTTRGLWELELPLKQLAMHAVNASAKPEDLIAFAHGALWSPTLSTLQTALQKGFLPDIPGLTVKLLQKYPPRSKATIKGHLDNVRKNIKSTRKEIDQELQQIHDDSFPTSPQINNRTHQVIAAVYDIRGQVHADLTGRLPPSSQGQQYILFAYDYDSNAILLRPIRNRQAKLILEAHQDVHRTLTKGGCQPQYYRLDNECSNMLKDFLAKEKIDYQLVPPHDHRRNAAERAIRTGKNHIIAGWCAADDDFPLHLWDRTIPTAELTLNLLRGSRINPKLSAWEQIHGRFDYNRTPIAPPGIRVLVHEKSSQRKTWDPHAQEAWYLGPALESYRCHRVYVIATRGERIVNTLTWFPQKLAMPIATPSDLIRTAIKDLTAALQSPTTGTAVSHLTPTETEQLQHLADLLTNKTDQAQPKPEWIDTIEQPLAIPKQVRFTAEAMENTKYTLTSHTLFPVDPESTPEPAPEPESDQDPVPVLRVETTPENTQPALRVPPVVTPERPIRHRTYFAATDQAVIQATKLLDDPQEILSTLTIPKHFALKAVNPDTGLDAEYPELLRSSEGQHWEEQMCHEIGRLFQGYKETKGTDTCRFIRITEMEKGRKATYARIVVADRPRKTEPRRVRMTVGGDKVDYPGEVTTKTTDLITAKVLINKVVSTPNARFMCVDIKDFYLNNVLPRKEYLRLPVSIIPQAIMDLYQLHDLVHNGYVYVEIGKGMYGLPQAGRVASDALLPRLKKAGYKPTGHTPGLFRHNNNSIVFCLTVDDFGVLYTNKTEAEHLRDTLQEHYTITEDWAGSNYCGLDIVWNYEGDRYADISMNGYVKKALQRFEHCPPVPPHDWQPW